MRHITKLGLMAGGAVVTGVTAYFVGAKVIAPSVSAKALGCSPDNPIPMPSSSAAAQKIKALAPILRGEWAKLVGGDMPSAALEIAFAQAWLESGVGTWWTNRGPGSEWANGPKGQAFFAKFPSAPPQGDMRNSHNLGARQCGVNDTGGSDYTCVPYGDSQADAQGAQHPIQASFRYYSSAEAGARDFLRSITKQWAAVAELKSGDVLGYAMRQGPKYRKDDPPNQKVFGREYNGGNGYYGGFGATMEERVGGYGRAIVSHLPAVAAALGHAKIYACIAPELIGAKGKYLPTAGIEGEARNPYCGCVSCSDMSGPHVHVACPDINRETGVSGHEATFAPVIEQEDGRFAVEGSTGTIIAATVISAIVAAVAGAVVTGALKERAEGEAADIVKKLRAVGIDYIDPGASPRKGWVKVESNDPKLLKALEFLGAKRDRLLQSLASKGFGFQAQRRIKVPAHLIRNAQQSKAPELAQDREPLRQIAQKDAPKDIASLADDWEKKISNALASTGIEYFPAEKPLPPGFSVVEWDDPRLRKVLESAIGLKGKELDDYIGSMKANAARFPQNTPRFAEEKLVFATATPQEAARRTFEGDTEPEFAQGIEGFGAGFSTSIGVLAALLVASGIAAVASSASDAIKIISNIKAAGIVPIRGGEEPSVGWSIVSADDPRIAKALSFLGADGPKLLSMLSEKGWRFQEKSNVSPPRDVSGEADVTAESAAASDAYATSRASIEGTGTAVAIAAGVVAAGLVAGAGIAAIASKAEPSAGPETPPVVPATTPVPVVPRGPAPPPKPSAPKNVPTVSRPSITTDEGVTAYKQPRASVSTPETPQEEPGLISSITSSIFGDDEETVAKRVPRKMQGFDAGEVLQTLHLSGALSRARVIPGTDGTRFVWYTEPPVLGFVKMDDPGARLLDVLLPGAGLATQTAIETTKRVIPQPSKPKKKRRLVRRRDVAEEFDIPAEDIVSVEDVYVSGADENNARFAPTIGAKDEPSDVAKAASTAMDVTDIFKSVTSIVDAGDKIARRYKKDDPKCLAAIRLWVEKHPIVSRFFAKELIPYTKIGIGDAGMFVDRYADELMRQRVSGATELDGILDNLRAFINGSPCGQNTYDPDNPDIGPSNCDQNAAERADCYPSIHKRIARVLHLSGALDACEPTQEEDRAVLGALMAPLGLSKGEEDAIYTAASRTAATALDLYAPGSGQGATQAADAISTLITGRRMAPGGDSVKKKPKPSAKADAKCRAALTQERGKVAVAKQWVSEHSILAAITSPDLRKISGVRTEGSGR